MSTRLPRAEKLPLALRKNIRDAWESQVESFAEQLSAVMKVPWSIDIDPNALYPYAQPGSWPAESLGSCIAEYVKGALYHVNNFESTLKDAGIKELNSIAYGHILQMDIDDYKEQRFDSCGADIHEGRLRIVISPGRFGANTNEAFNQRWLEKAMNEAAPPPGSADQLSYATRRGIRDDFDKTIKEVNSSIAGILQTESVTLEPNFDDTFARFKKQAETDKTKLNYPDRWQELLGSFTLLYFKGFAGQLDRRGFRDDEMLREALIDAVDSRKIEFRIVDQLQYRSDCEVVIENGVLYIQSTAARWGSNIEDAGVQIVDQL